MHTILQLELKHHGYPEDKIETYLDLKQAVKSLYETDTKKYVIANYTSLQPTRTEILKLK